ncbi:LysR family hydrogen peroxide-inducible transcriptional activator [Endobacter medicaginis]|uniref:LysR family hydrogen peroxide-inducible transcriptional activator n=2 Tax=Endobacter medicaginis TaxID=1181271 RepID=A0A839UZT7_9PROT|nr:hydrogen peroxide-inducible genes activator [Endobacter medicaginis]MBB3173640.1 LysR family hydrogen peroxide-inducible transcriptional activator [Endobacter medicaginis]MCX5477070.1 hydrogen peroxide-inducible genes activator [Endobacter medicaginis]
MPPLPSPQQLRYLVALAEARHFGRAAAVCAVTQSTLSAGVIALERQLGASLLQREGSRGVVFTTEGEEVVRRARTALAALESVAASVGQAEAVEIADLRLGLIPTIGPFVLDRLLAARGERLRLSLREDVTDRLLRGLEAQRLDAALLAVPCDCRGLETVPVLRDELVVALPQAHRLAGQESLSMAMLRDEPMLLLEDGHCLRDHVLTACREQSGWDLSESGEGFAATGLHMLTRMVAAGLGVTLLPKLAVDAGLADGLAVRPLSGGDAGGAWRTIALAFRSGDAQADALRAFAARLARGLRRPVIQAG